MEPFETFFLFLIAIIFLISEIGAYSAWKHLRLIKNLEKTHANFLYAVHLLSYLIIAGYIRNYSYFIAAIDGGNAYYMSQGAIYLIVITNMAPAFYLQAKLK